MPSDPQRVQNIFLQIVELSPAERPAVLDRECGSDVGLRQRIEALLKAHEESDSLLDQPSDRFGATVVSGAAHNAPADMIGQRRPEAGSSKRSGSPGTAETNIREESTAGAVIAGRYTMVQRIGEGGMGEVWVAKQTEPVKRKVALKLIKMGMDSKAVLQRFEQERQALALMDHPNIARVFDGGITQSGQPYFVMELVNGLPLNKFCDEARLTPNERLQLFIPICHAVQHAHQKGIVHRDLKPANILVTMIDGKPVPKVIDFGVAKATSGKLTDESLSTQFGAVVGTLEYMSPEQAGFSGEDIDTRADIYSLGVILYEMLTGLRPIDAKRMKNAAIVEMIRMIREDEPSKPSTRLSTDESLPSMAALRQTEPKRLMALLRGELDWVVMKCLEKSRDRRYETANALSRDIQRYLADEPVEARPPSAGYRLSKFLRRHRGPVIAASVVLLTLVGGMVGTAFFALRADQNATAASASARTADENARVAAIEKDRADARANDARRNMYVAHMNLAQSNWEGTNVGATSELLARYAPGTPNADLRGFEWHYWDRLIHSPLLDLNGHSDAVTSVAFSPDGKFLASASWDKTIKVWDAKSGQETLSLRHPGGAGTIVFSPDAKRLASAGSDGTLRVWDVMSGQETLRIPGHTEEVSDVVFSPDGKRLASASYDKTVKVWDATTGQEILTLKGTNVEVSCLAFSPDGKWLASDGVSGAITMWDATSGQEVLTLTEITDEVSCLAFSPDGKWLASNGIGETVTMWDTTSGQKTLTLNTGGDGQFAFSPDGKRLASVSGQQAVKVWDLASGQQLLTLKGHTLQVYGVVFSPDGKRLASAGSDGTVKVWDAVIGQETLTLKGNKFGVRSVGFSPDGKWLASNGISETVKVWDATMGQEMRTLNTGRGIGVDIGVGAAVVISPDGKRLASSSWNKTVKVWDATSGQEMLTLRGHSDSVLSVAFSPDGTRLASASGDGTVKIWDAASGQEMLTLIGHTFWVSSVVFSPDGKRLASASGDNTVKVWDATSGQETLTMKGHTSIVSNVVFSLDGKRLASASYDNTVKVWNATTGEETLTLKGHTRQVYFVTFSPDGKRLASGSEDRMVKVWDAISGQETLSLKGHSLGVLSMAFSPDGNRLASACTDGTVKVWDSRLWTPDLRIETEALGLIHFLRDQGKTHQEWLNFITADQTISELVRERALQFAIQWIGYERARPDPTDPEELPLRATEMIRRGELAVAVRAGDKLRELQPKDNGNLYNAACVYALCAAFVTKDKPAPTDAERSERQKFVNLAIESLQQAITSGWDDFDHMGKDTDLNALHGLPGFEALFPKE